MFGDDTKLFEVKNRQPEMNLSSLEPGSADEFSLLFKKMSFCSKPLGMGRMVPDGPTWSQMVNHPMTAVSGCQSGAQFR